MRSSRVGGVGGSSDVCTSDLDHVLATSADLARVRSVCLCSTTCVAIGLRRTLLQQQGKSTSVPAHMINLGCESARGASVCSRQDRQSLRAGKPIGIWLGRAATQTVISKTR